MVLRPSIEGTCVWKGFNLLLCFREHLPNLLASCTVLNGGKLTGDENNPSTFLQLLAIHVTPLYLITSANFTPVKDLIKGSVGPTIPSGMENELFCGSELLISHCLCWLQYYEVRYGFCLLPFLFYFFCLSHPTGGCRSESLENAQGQYFCLLPSISRLDVFLCLGD